jgi:hypothetical protein
VGGRPSARVRDLVDVVAIANTSAIDAVRLAEVIMVIFGRRKEHPVLTALPASPAAAGNAVAAAGPRRACHG